jgi:acyl-CoA reductase-like NAD-dependent aldehyde dehydrogenase
MCLQCKPSERDRISVYEFNFPVSVVSRRIFWGSVLVITVVAGAASSPKPKTVPCCSRQLRAEAVYPQVVNVVAVHYPVTKPLCQSRGIQTLINRVANSATFMRPRGRHLRPCA